MDQPDTPRCEGRYACAHCGTWWQARYIGAGICDSCTHDALVYSHPEGGTTATQHDRADLHPKTVGTPPLGSAGHKV